jgi:hypothetical protein
MIATVLIRKVVRSELNTNPKLPRVKKVIINAATMEAMCLDVKRDSSGQNA